MDDLIRRSDAIEALYKYNFVTKEVIEREIMDIPSADRPRGEWIFHSEWEEYYCRYECSLCGRTYDYDMNYCGFCGARMKGADDETTND